MIGSSRTKPRLAAVLIGAALAAALAPGAPAATWEQLHVNPSTGFPSTPTPVTAQGSGSGADQVASSRPSDPAPARDDASTSGSFEWFSAAIGAVAATALLLALLAVTGALGQRHLRIGRRAVRT
jgi:hypothetical protein